MLRLLLGGDWTANRKEILARIGADVHARQGNRILIVPELISHDAERRLAQAAGDTASRYAQVLSFTQLGRRVSDLVGDAALQCLDNSGRVVAMAAAARQLHSRLKTYASVETKPEFLQQILDAVDEMKRCCIAPADLKAAAVQTQGILAQKLEELSLLMESYDSLCAQGKRDPRDQMSWVLEQLEQTDFAREHVFYVDGFPDFTRQNLAILEHIILSGGDITVSMTCDSLHSTAVAFEKAAQTAAQLHQIAMRGHIPVAVEQVAQRRDALAAMRQGLFQGALQVELQGRVRAVQANSLYQQCQLAAQEILRLVQQGERYREIALVCTQPETQLPTLELIFGKCQIPLYRSGTEEVLRSGVISTLLFALDAALGGFEQREVLRYLRTTLSPLSQEECDRIENYAYIWSVSGKAWLETWTEHPQGLQQQWDELSRRALEELNEARRTAMQPLEQLRQELRQAKDVAGQVRALYEFLEQIRYRERLERLSDEMQQCGDARTAQIYQQLWEILLGALEQLYDVLGATAWECDAFVHLLKLLLSQCDVGTIPPVLDAVSVGAVSAMRCQEQKHLIVLGADEGVLPGYGGAKGLLSDQERTELRGLGLPLTGGAMEGLQAEFAEIYGVFCGARERVLILAGAQPSFLFDRLAAMSGGAEKAEEVRVAPLRQKMAAAAYLAQYGRWQEAQTLDVQAQYLRIRTAAAHGFGRVSAENIRKLYGRTLRLSASQVDRQAECKLSYFLKYGLRARERKQADIDPAEFGTYVHAVLEKTGKAVMEQGGFHKVSLEATLALAQRFSQAYLQENFAQLRSERVQYLFRRNVQELELVVRELWQELHRAEYEPAYFELKFDDDGAMPAIDIPNGRIPAQIRGFVDRVDLWRRGDSTYFRVVDYKTGKKTFDYCDVFNGVGLQMLIYLFALEQGGQALLPGRRISAGVQYFPARAPYLKAEGSLSDEEAANARRAECKRSGLLLSDMDSLQAMDPTEKMETLSCTRRKDGTLSGAVADRQQLRMLSDRMMTLLSRMVSDIADGDVQPNPYTRGSAHDACSFCPYGAVCHPQTVAGRRDYKMMKAEEFWQEIEKEVQGHG